MRIPDSLFALAECGIIDKVVRPLMSGKEAQVYLVIAGGEERVAKIYKDAVNRSFKNRAEYTEGRGVRSTRDQRAIGKRSTHGRAQDEAAWRETEVSMIYRLQNAGVRVPVAYNFIDGVLVMELIKDAEGHPAPRLAEVALSAEIATEIYGLLIREVVRMLSAGVVHCDLSDFNVLMSADGPVLIDFPQAVDAAHNQNARKLLLRDVDNLHDFLSRYVRGARRQPYAEEMWDLYERNALTPETPLTGSYRASDHHADTASVLALIEDANRDERRRREFLGLRGGPPAPAVKLPPAQTPRGARPRTSSPPHPPHPPRAAPPRAPSTQPTAPAGTAPGGRSRRRRRRRG
jgi:RIO kinase 1